MNDLFSDESSAGDFAAPLPERLRPRTLDDIVGQEAAFGEHTALGAALRLGKLPSLVLWGPPGCGKTTLAACLAREVGGRFLPHSAVRVGVKELRKIIDEAKRLRTMDGREPILFLDEIHRFNKAQQDALLPHVEAGDVTLIGATTENPSFEVNAALLSRTRVVTLQPLGIDDIVELLRRALEDPRGLAGGVRIVDGGLNKIAERSGGDARFALNSLELVARSVDGPTQEVDLERIESALKHAYLQYDRAGEEHFNLASALQKSIRNSDAQACLYWMTRMLEAGEDPVYVARRLTRIASEDVGLADPQALVQCTAALSAVQLMGMPECSLALAQAAIYLAQAPKSNRLELAYLKARQAIRDGATDPVPLHLRNAPTRLMEEKGYGAGYQYSHDAPGGVAPMQGLPESLAGQKFYAPGTVGFEVEVQARLRRAEELRAKRKGPGEDPPEPS